MIFDLNKYFIKPDASLKHAIEMLNLNSGRGLVVVDEEKTLLGTITDGDIRRAIIRESGFDSSVSEVMFTNPVVAKPSDGFDKISKNAEQKLIKIIPIVKDNKVIDLFIVNDDEGVTIPVVLMAGGLGSRLGDHTKNCPKPMLSVGGKPVLERILENFTKSGFSRFFISVNYKAEMIEDYFSNGKKFFCDISYLKEKKRLGTAGSLSLLPDGIKGPVIVMNGDLLTHINFRRLVQFHELHNSPITMCVREYEFQVPYGVVNLEDGKAKSFDEKPIQSFYVNAGVYIIDSSLFKYIPNDEYFDMSSYLNKLIDLGINANCFPMVEKWIDIGQISDLNHARKEYSESNE